MSYVKQIIKNHLVAYKKFKFQMIKNKSITAKLNVCEYEENYTTICLKENIA